MPHCVLAGPPWNAARWVSAALAAVAWVNLSCSIQVATTSRHAARQAACQKRLVELGGIEPPSESPCRADLHV